MASGSDRLEKKHEEISIMADIEMKIFLSRMDEIPMDREVASMP